MATVAGTVKGIVLLKEDPSNDDIKLALVTFTLGAYTASTDNGQLTAIGVAIKNQRRDGKTVTLLGGATAGRGLQGSTKFQTGTWAVSSDNLTFNLNDTAGSEVDAASGVTTRPLAVVIAYTHV
jgi:hypothetical protein